MGNDNELGYSCSFPTIFTTPYCFKFGTATSTTQTPSPSIIGRFSGQKEDALSQSLKSVWKITRTYNSVENPGILKLWLLEFGDLLRDYHDKNYNYTRHPTKTEDNVLL
jgi:hypothetical protein